MGQWALLQGTLVGETFLFLDGPGLDVGKQQTTAVGCNVGNYTQGRLVGVLLGFPCSFLRVTGGPGLDLGNDKEQRCGSGHVDYVVWFGVFFFTICFFS